MTATLHFSFGTVGSGKSTVEHEIHHDAPCASLGHLCTELDREGEQVTISKVPPGATQSAMRS